MTRRRRGWLRQARFKTRAAFTVRTCGRRQPARGSEREPKLYRQRVYSKGRAATEGTSNSLARLEGTGDRGDLMHAIHPEERRHVQAAEILSGVFQPREHEVALAVIRGATGGDRASASGRAGRGNGAALQVALLQNGDKKEADSDGVCGDRKEGRK